MMPSPLSPTHTAPVPVDPCHAARHFEALFHGPATHQVFSPGRVNVIGEHTDYSGGLVLPFALSLGTTFLGRPRSDRMLEVVSAAMGESRCWSLSELPETPTPGDWGNGLLGMATLLQRAGYVLPGASVLIENDLPVGAGLSASASLTVGMGFLLLSLAGVTDIDRLALARLAQVAEHQFVGTQCGLLDQLAVAFGQPGKALLIDLEHVVIQPVRLELPDTEWRVVDTGVKHDLATSAYNQRRAEVSQAVRELQEARPAWTSLRALSPEDLSDALPYLSSDTLRHRVRHVVTENARVLAVVDALRHQDAAAVGRALNASHSSLRLDFAVSSPELDVLANLAQETPGVYGSRMMGGGFGGCTLSLLEASAVHRFDERLVRGYTDVFGVAPHPPLAVSPAGGVRLETPARLES